MTLLREGSQGICVTAHYPAHVFEFKKEGAEKISLKTYLPHRNVPEVTLPPTAEHLLLFMVFK